MKNKILRFTILILLCFSVIAAAGTLSIEEDPARINLDIKDMSILDVLRILAEQGQVNIVASRNVQGRVTAKLKDVTVKQALDAILDANNFMYEEGKGIIKVFTHQDALQKEQTEILASRVFFMSNIKASDLRPVLNSIKSARGRVEINTMSNQVIVTDSIKKLMEVEEAIFILDRKLITQVYELNYGDAKEIQAKLIEIIPKEEGEVIIDERTNSLVIRAIPEVVRKVDQMIKNWDQRPMQVLIEAKILEISLDKTKGIGINWEYLSTSGDDAVNVSATLPASVSAGGVLRVGTLSADQYQITLQMLESATNTNILSNPRIVVIDNQEANILVGSSEPYLVTYIDSESKTQTEETKFIDVGIKLNVTPKISKNGFITLKIHPEVSSARRVAEVNNSLAVDTTQADTTVVVKDGKTIVLGGLIKDTESDVVTKIPVLGDIPLLGLFFRSKAKTNTKREIVVFITPHILKNEVEFMPESNYREQAINKAINSAAIKWREWEEKADGIR
ncbi:MAG: secretin and TonB N-terminal domain-containing protein [Candidatus Omnitrophica bacterium]|nr:secretin and TonB N-terminal domain-containing protein [Candidatus Omnitrophota bacterium]